MLLNHNIIDIEKPDRICSPTFVVDKFSGLFLQNKNNKICYFWTLALKSMFRIITSLFLKKII